MRRTEAETLARRVMTVHDPAERRNTLMNWLKEHTPDYYAFLKESEESSLEIEP